MKQLIKQSKNQNAKQLKLQEIPPCKLRFKQLLIQLQQQKQRLPAAPAVTQSVARANRPVYSSSASSYPVGQCTWGAKTLAPWAGDYWGNGGQWSASAAAAGFRVGSQPEVGAIACWTDGGYGHVDSSNSCSIYYKHPSIRSKLPWTTINR